jgi:hypothetical protein
VSDNLRWHTRRSVTAFHQSQEVLLTRDTIRFAEADAGARDEKHVGADIDTWRKNGFPLEGTEAFAMR